MPVLSAASQAKLAAVRPELARVVRRAIEITTQDFAVTSGARTAEEQNALFQQGRTKPGPKVTEKDGYTRPSNHQITADGFGHAVDLVPWVGAKPVWDESFTLHYPVAVAMALAARELGVKIVWGGNWAEPMAAYPATVEGMRDAVQRYKRAKGGRGFLDAPHFEWRP